MHSTETAFLVRSGFPLKKRKKRHFSSLKYDIRVAIFENLKSINSKEIEFVVTLKKIKLNGIKLNKIYVETLLKRIENTKRFLILKIIIRVLKLLKISPSNHSNHGNFCSLSVYVLAACPTVANYPMQSLAIYA